MTVDRYGNLVTTSAQKALDAYVKGSDLLLSANAGAGAAFEDAVGADPDFVLAHVALARVRQLSGLAAEGRDILAATKPFLGRVTERERSHFAIFETLLAGDGAGALSAMRGHLATWPRDAMALAPATGVFGLVGFSGKPGREQDQLDLLAPLATHYGDDWWFLGALAFAEFELGLIDAGRAHVDKALEGNPRNANAAHISAHGYYEAGESDAGIHFLDAWMPDYSPEAALHGHLRWHRAIWALQRGDAATAWSLYETSIRPGANLGPAINLLTDSASFLFRAELAGERVPENEWRRIADYAGTFFPNAGISFADFHVALAYAMTGDGERLARLTEDPRGAAGDVVAPVSRAFGAFARGDWAAVSVELDPVLGVHERLGGSRAQRDLIEFTNTVALLRSGRAEDAARRLRARRGTVLTGGVPIAGME